MKKFIAYLLFLGVFITGYYALKRLEKVPSNNELLVGLSADYPPFAFLKDTKIVGLDVDILQEVSKRLGKKLVIRDIPFDMLIPEIQIGSLHLLASGMTETPLRAKRVLFTKPYYQGDPLLIITPKTTIKKITNVEDFIGLSVIVNDGFTADTYLTGLNNNNFTLHRLKSLAESFLALETGKADIYVIAQTAAQPFFNATPNHNYVITVLPNTADSYAFAVAKKYPEMRVVVQEALDAMTADGTLNTILKKWNFV